MGAGGALLTGAQLRSACSEGSVRPCCVSAHTPVTMAMLREQQHQPLAATAVPLLCMAGLLRRAAVPASTCLVCLPGARVCNMHQFGAGSKAALICPDPEQSPRQLSFACCLSAKTSSPTRATFGDEYKFRCPRCTRTGPWSGDPQECCCCCPFAAAASGCCQWGRQQVG